MGNGHLAKQYLESIRENPQMGIRSIGYVSRAERPELGKCLGSYEDLEKILIRYKPDELIVALEPHETKFMKPVLDAADKGLPGVVPCSPAGFFAFCYTHTAEFYHGKRLFILTFAFC